MPAVHADRDQPAHAQERVGQNREHGRERRFAAAGDAGQAGNHPPAIAQRGREQMQHGQIGRCEVVAGDGNRDRVAGHVDRQLSRQRLQRLQPLGGEHIRLRYIVHAFQSTRCRPISKARHRRGN